MHIPYFYRNTVSICLECVDSKLEIIHLPVIAYFKSTYTMLRTVHVLNVSVSLFCPYFGSSKFHLDIFWNVCELTGTTQSTVSTSIILEKEFVTCRGIVKSGCISTFVSGNAAEKFYFSVNVRSNLKESKWG